MKDYPRFPASLSHEELVEHFLLDSTDHQFIAQFRGETNRHGVAVLLKSLHYLGYFPQHQYVVPASVKSFIAKQLNLYEDPSSKYPWDSGTRGDHFAQIRRYTGFRFPTTVDKEDLSSWFWRSAAYQAITFSSLFECAIKQLRSLRIELPSEKELIRLVNSALNSFFVDTYHQVTDELNEAVRSSSFSSS